MLGIVFGFSGRIGRLHYFLLTTALAFLVTALIVPITLLIAPHFTQGGNLSDDGQTAIVVTCMAVALPIYLWFTLTLAAKRFRDMGWHPLTTLVAWTAIIVADLLVAAQFPWTTLGGYQGQTLVGSVLNVVMIGCLLFWPSAADGDRPDTSLPTPFDTAAEPLAARAAVMSRPSARTGFGRRGL